ncbi:MAG: hypothetical protein GY759_06675 [Chloroflexi bacterium]|nr:hypothetical protein [Chloroflexota bacterium]
MGFESETGRPPAATGIPPLLTPLVALGLASTMSGAAYTHIRRGECAMTIMNVVLLLMPLSVLAIASGVAF